MTTHPLLLALPLALTLPAGCSNDAGGTSTVDVRVYGESFIEDGIPADDMSDDWAVEFSRFDVELRGIVVAGKALSDPQSIDLSVGSDGKGHEVGTLTVDTRGDGEPRFTIARVEVEGSAEQGSDTKTFSWVFDSPTRYEQCETTTQVQKNGAAKFQITVHADHFFYDSLVAADPQLLFQPLADADTDDDGEITEAELGAADIGGHDPGNEDIDDLWTWLIAQSRTLGHVDGEGHCEATAAN